MNLTLKKTQKNNVLDAITSSGLNPSNFNWNIIDSRESTLSKISQLCYKDSPYFFNFDFYDDETRWVRYSPGADLMITDCAVGGNNGWKDTKTNVLRWLSALKEEIEEPDLWKRLGEYGSPDGASPIEDTSNEQFTAIEVDRITESIQQAQQFIEKHYEKNEAIEEKLDYLIESSKRMGKRDWLNICIGTLVTLGIQYSIEKDHLQQIWNLIKEGLTGIIQFMPQ